MASDVWFDADMMHVRLADGREIAVPLEWFPTLRQASDSERNDWRMIGGGVGIHWQKLDEDLLVAELLEA